MKQKQQKTCFPKQILLPYLLVCAQYVIFQTFDSNSLTGAVANGALVFGSPLVFLLIVRWYYHRRWKLRRPSSKSEYNYSKE